MGHVHTYPTTTTATADRRLSPGRLLDVLVGSTLLVVTLPLIGMLALAVRRSSNGPILRHERTHDRHGRPVEVLSFRTTLDGGTTEHHQRLRAIVGADAGVPLTGIGRFMRATRTDRLPRLVSVVRGDASLLR